MVTVLKPRYLLAMLGAFMIAAAGLDFWEVQSLRLPTVTDTGEDSQAAAAEAPHQSRVESGILQEDTLAAVPVAPVPEEPRGSWVEHRIVRGDTLAAIFARYGIDARYLQRLLSADDPLADTLTQLYPGRALKFLVKPDGTLEKLVYERSRMERLEATPTATGFAIEKILEHPLRELRHARGAIDSTLYEAGHQAGLSDKLIMALTEIFGWDIDFARSIRPGDRFQVLYEKLRLDGEVIGDGPIIAAEFVNQGKVHRAIRFVHPDGHVDYYTPEGRSLRKAFLRTPVKSARISSRFNLHRRHPVLHRIRAHKGVDYAAPIGTPVHATGDGRIIFRGWKGGYGRVVILDHGRGYTTLYAHLHRFGKFKQGSRVRQGDVIGYIGKSGLATGPHLHYEFRINGVHRDPLTVPLPDSQPLPAGLRTAFAQQAAPLLAELEKPTPGSLARTETKR
ncbi:peptidoglycan DD-metalloendopeptidase family protein [Methylomarinovum caldicuralii]|nr:peptidoglycan DD-metalloendopeptidase family protein [Methylomarinovum caldicuralii]